jgi:Rrf2 family protein
MIELTNKTIYSLKILLELSKSYNKSIMQINDFNKKQNIPKSFLIQLLNKLKNLKLIDSIRGNKGGYRLAVSPDNIIVFEIIDKLEGGFEIFKNYKDKDYLKMIFNKSMDALKQNLNISLKEVLLQQEKLENNVMYFI